MKKSFIIIITFLVSTLSFSQNKFGNPEVDPIQIQKTFTDWSVYQSKKIMLSRDFTALDAESKEISKEAF
ncbi:hypothetical protein ACQ9BO_20620 [Flavobacterium sp. P21]|uniref:hypothetical protein n=1 Tax=Flavobacterium sp. P21 TaxID=3423948 RepID=UPI003D67CD07